MHIFLESKPLKYPSISISFVLTGAITYFPLKFDLLLPPGNLEGEKQLFLFGKMENHFFSDHLHKDLPSCQFPISQVSRALVIFGNQLTLPVHSFQCLFLTYLIPSIFSGKFAHTPLLALGLGDIGMLPGDDMLGHGHSSEPGRSGSAC